MNNINKNEKKSASAITLIALVITIVVLLILAGVALSLVVGENGITERAVKASKIQNISGAKEKLELQVADYAGEFYQAKYVNGSVGDSETVGGYVLGKFDNGSDFEGDYTLTKADNKITITNKKDASQKATATIDGNGKVSWSGTVVSAGETQKVALKKVSDESSAKDACVEEEVKIGDEHFYVIKADDTTLTLLAKYNLNQVGTKQQNADTETTACAFSNSNYWSADWAVYYAEGKPELEVRPWGDRIWSGIFLNLNECEIPTTGENPETSNNNAILKSIKYGSDLGGRGRLLTIEEAKTIESGTDDDLKKILYGEDSVQGHLSYWIGSAHVDDDVSVWDVYFVRKRYNDYEGVLF